jgi:hypothetical protein
VNSRSGLGPPNFDTADAVNEDGVPSDGKPGSGVAAATCSAAVLFSALWEALADVLGTAAAATLLKRAARRAGIRSPELAELVFQREELRYGYSLPPAWKQETEETPSALRELVAELRPILVELTGNVVLRHLEQFPQLRRLFPEQEQDR